MFSEIYSSKSPQPWQSYAIMLCAILVTVGTLVFPNLEHVYGSFDKNTEFFSRLSIAFQHGFDPMSASIHLLVNLVLFVIIGIYTEKILGAKLFFLLNCLALLTYVLFHFIFSMLGHGLAGIIWAYVPVVMYSLNEGRVLKTRSVFDEFYQTLRLIILSMITLFPLLYSIIPIYFDIELPFYWAIFYGNILLLVALLTGAGFVYFFKSQIRARMKHFAKKKKFEASRSDDNSIFFACFYPIYILILFFFAR